MSGHTQTRMSLLSLAPPTSLTLDGLALRLPNQTPGLELIIMYNLSCPHLLKLISSLCSRKTTLILVSSFGWPDEKISLSEKPAASDFWLLCKQWAERDTHSSLHMRNQELPFMTCPVLPLITSEARLVSRPLLLAQTLPASDFRLLCKPLFCLVLGQEATEIPLSASLELNRETWERLPLKRVCVCTWEVAGGRNVFKKESSSRFRDLLHHISL